MSRQFYFKSEPFEFSPEITLEQEQFEFEPEDFGFEWDSEEWEEEIKRGSQRPAASAVLMALLNDRDAGVRKLAIKSSATRDNSALLAKIGDLSRSDPTPAVRSLAAKVVDLARRKRSTGLA